MALPIVPVMAAQWLSPAATRTAVNVLVGNDHTGGGSL